MRKTLILLGLSHINFFRKILKTADFLFIRRSDVISPVQFLLQLWVLLFCVSLSGRKAF